MSLRRLQGVFKTSSRPLQSVFKTSSRRFEDVFKRSSRRFEDVFKMSSWHLQDVLQRYLQDVSKAYHQVNLFYLTRPKESIQQVSLYRGVCLGNTTSEKNMVSVQSLQERYIKLSSFSFSFYCTFLWLLTEAYLGPGRTSTVAFFCGNT